MKIYKETQEATEPIYIQEHVRSGENFFHRVYITVTAYNQEDHALDYTTDAGSYLAMDDKNKKLVIEQADRIIKDIRYQLAQKGLKVYPGVISDKIITGQPYKLANTKIAFDLSEACTHDPEGNEIEEKEPYAPKS